MGFVLYGLDFQCRLRSASPRRCSGCCIAWTSTFGGTHKKTPHRDTRGAKFYASLSIILVGFRLLTGSSRDTAI